MKLIQCEMCGKETNVVRALVEGSELEVCKECAKYGRIIRAPVFNLPQNQRKQIKPVQKDEVIEIIIEDYAQKIKLAREKLGLMQKELAIKLAERESILQKLENGQIKPSIALAKKLEKFLNISLIKEEKLEAVPQEKYKSSTLTLGDILLKKNH